MAGKVANAQAAHHSDDLSDCQPAAARKAAFFVRGG
jgi:hypothetical protein